MARECSHARSARNCQKGIPHPFSLDVIEIIYTEYHFQILIFPAASKFHPSFLQPFFAAGCNFFSLSVRKTTHAVKKVFGFRQRKKDASETTPRRKWKRKRKLRDAKMKRLGKNNSVVNWHFVAVQWYTTFLTGKTFPTLLAWLFFFFNNTFSSYHVHHILRGEGEG